MYNKINYLHIRTLNKDHSKQDFLEYFLSWVVEAVPTQHQSCTVIKKLMTITLHGSYLHTYIRSTLVNTS